MYDAEINGRRSRGRTRRTCNDQVSRMLKSSHMKSVSLRKGFISGFLKMHFPSRRLQTVIWQIVFTKWWIKNYTYKGLDIGLFQMDPYYVIGIFDSMTHSVAYFQNATRRREKHLYHRLLRNPSILSHSSSIVNTIIENKLPTK